MKVGDVCPLCVTGMLHRSIGRDPPVLTCDNAFCSGTFNETPEESVTCFACGRDGVPKMAHLWSERAKYRCECRYCECRAPFADSREGALKEWQRLCGRWNDTMMVLVHKDCGCVVDLQQSDDPLVGSQATCARCGPIAVKDLLAGKIVPADGGYAVDIRGFVTENDMKTPVVQPKSWRVPVGSMWPAIITIAVTAATVLGICLVLAHRYGERYAEASKPKSYTGRPERGLPRPIPRPPKRPKPETPTPKVAEYQRGKVRSPMFLWETRDPEIKGPHPLIKRIKTNGVPERLTLISLFPIKTVEIYGVLPRTGQTAAHLGSVPVPKLGTFNATGQLPNNGANAVVYAYDKIKGPGHRWCVKIYVKLYPGTYDIRSTVDTEAVKRR